MASEIIGQNGRLVYRDGRIWDIYKVTCRPNGRIYFGMTGIGTAKRWRMHVATAKRGERGCIVLNRAIRKYGADAFTVEVIYAAMDHAEACRVERLMIATFQTIAPFGMNRALGGNNLGGRLGPMADETKRKLSLKIKGRRHTPEAIEKIVESLKGRKWTEEQRRKFIASRSGIPMPDHVKAALLAFHTGRKHPPEEIAKQVASRAGYRHSPEAIEKIRALQGNKPKTTRTKLADAVRRHWASMSPEDRANRSAAIAQGMRAGKR